MNFGLKDFFMGVVHLFVIFLPGSLLLLTILVASPGTDELDRVVRKLNISAGGLTLVFIGASYFLGHLVSLIASAIEDEFWTKPWIVDEKSKDEYQPGKIKAWLEGRKELREFALTVCQRELKGVVHVKDKKLRRWAQHLVRHRDAALRADIDAKDADRRFFRNTRLVLIAPLILATYKLDEGEISWVVPAVLALITLLAWLRYHEQDGKFTKLVFQSLIVLCADPDGKIEEKKTTN